jgi:hypothetical protein
MGTISYLRDRRRCQPGADARQAAITVSAYGFGIGTTFVPWQSVSEIRAFKADPASCDAFHLEFLFADQCIAVGEEQMGFAPLEEAMIAVFPGTGRWREAVLQPACARDLAVLYRRAPP